MLDAPPEEHDAGAQRHHGDVRIVAPARAGERDDVVVERQAERGGQADGSRPDRGAEHVGEPDREQGEECGREADGDVAPSEQREEDLGREREHGLAKVRAVERRHVPPRVEIGVRIAAVVRRGAVLVRIQRFRQPRQRGRTNRVGPKDRALLHRGHPGPVGRTIPRGDRIDAQERTVNQDAGEQRPRERRPNPRAAGACDRSTPAPPSRGPFRRGHPDREQDHQRARCSRGRDAASPRRLARVDSSAASVSGLPPRGARAARRPARPSPRCVEASASTR